MTVHVDVGPLAMDEVVAVARDGADVALTDQAVAAIDRARAASGGREAVAAGTFSVTVMCAA